MFFFFSWWLSFEKNIFVSFIWAFAGKKLYHDLEMIKGKQSIL